jgi:hypothetical protein
MLYILLKLLAYVGCFVDTNDRLLPSAHITGNYVDVEYCIKFCNGRGFPFAGLQVTTNLLKVELYLDMLPSCRVFRYADYIVCK